MADARPSNRWIDEQAAEYADLVGSFVESVHDEETDEMIEYQLIWEGGDLGVALTPLENEPMGVMVSRVTGKGFPFGIKNVGSGDILLSINLRDTTKMTLDQVVAFLQECDLPATLRFKKVSPDTDRPSAPPAVPRVSHFVVTSDVPTSPVGSSRPPASSSAASNRMSQKAVAAGATYAQQQQQSRTTRGESAASNRTSAQYGRSSSGRPSDAAAVPPPAATRQTSGNAANAPPAPVAAPAAHEEAAAAQMMARMTVDSYGSATEERESWKSSEGDIDEARERMAAHQSEEKEEEDDEPIAMPMPVPTLARGESNEEEQPQRKHAQSVAMLGDFSIETNGIPILPEESIGMIVSVDGVPQADADDDVSPIGHAVQPTAASRISHVPGTMPPIDDKPDMPRESVRLTMDGAAEPMMKSQPIGALHELCAKGNLRSVMQHIKVNGPDQLIQREANHGQTCLHLAVKSGNVQLVKHILEQYEPVDELINVEDDKGNTALHFAATKTPGMVHMLLETGASANVKNSRKLTPLIISVITSRDDNVIIPRMLLKYGANPNDMHDSQTVIHTAVGSGLLHIAGALVRAGAKMDVEDTEGKSIYEKLDKKSLRFLISHIYFPPTHITEKERTDCMLCHKKIKFGHRKNNCTHCGRLCCSECCSLAVEMYKFPMGFPGRVRKGAAVRDLKKVCKTCYGVFKERGDTPQKEESRFFNRVIGIEWDEVNPNKMDSYRAAGRRGEKDY